MRVSAQLKGNKKHLYDWNCNWDCLLFHEIQLLSELYLLILFIFLSGIYSVLIKSELKRQAANEHRHEEENGYEVILNIQFLVYIFIPLVQMHIGAYSVLDLIWEFWENCLYYRFCGNCHLATITALHCYIFIWFNSCTYQVSLLRATKSFWWAVPFEGIRPQHI